MIAQHSKTNKASRHLGWALALLAGCGRSPTPPPPDATPAEPPHVGQPDSAPSGAAPAAPSTAAPPSVPPGTLGRAGAVLINEATFKEAIEEARVLQHWRDGQAPPLAALASPVLRRRLLIQALETRVVRAEVARRGLDVTPSALEAAVRNAADGRPFDAPRPADEAPADPDELAARLSARYEAPVAVVRRVALDLLEGRRLIDTLLDAEPDAAHRQRWVDDQTRISLDLLKIPRIPTAAEIGEAARTREADLVAWHARHPALFRKPERARVQRVVVEGPDAAARAQALHARAAAGESMDALAQEAAGKPVRPGDRSLLVTRERLPVAFEVAAGQLTPVVPEGAALAFYRVETRMPAVERALTDESVRREVAAGLLREEDRLPHARAVAERAARLLRSAPDGPELTALLAENRVIRATTKPFARSGDLVPEVGVSPALFQAVFALSPERPVTDIIPVRQDYIVARLVTREDPDLTRWPAERAAAITAWRAAEQTRVIDRWLSTHLQGAPLWVDMPAVTALQVGEEKKPQ